MSILGAKHPEFAAWEAEICAGVQGGGPFAVHGGGTRRIGLCEGASLSAADATWDYDPGALTLTVAAGVPVEVIDKMLVTERQRIAFEVPDLRGLLGRDGISTIGGIVATNASGPRRVGVGACRDFCLGVGFVDGRGRAIKNGGRVMKNVTGLDLVKLMAGSHGTLGLLTEISLKVQPVPEMAATLIIEGLSEPEAVAAMSAALGTPFDVTGAAHLPAGVGVAARTLIRLEGFESSVAYRMGALQTALAAFGDSAVDWDSVTNDETWSAIRDVARFHGTDGDVWRVSVKPSDAPALVAAVQPEDVLYDWGGGRLWLLTQAGMDVRTKMGAGHATLIRASDGTKRRLGVFHPENAVVAKLSGGLRRKFDPDQKFNRGMMG